MRTAMLWSVLAASCAGTAAMADEITFGKLEYMNACAQCHGEDGTGGGPMAGYLTTALPDLTQLQKANGGVFPLNAVYTVIDGSGEMGPHGSREMPAWGDRYKTQAEGQLSMDFGVTRETYTRTRILALIEHLASLQAK